MDSETLKKVLSQSTTTDLPHVSYIQGSFDQYDPQFAHFAGKQCVPNSLTAIEMSALKNVLTWTTEDLNEILLHGNELYGSMRTVGAISHGPGYVAVSELPRKHTLCNKSFTIKYGDSIAGVIGV